MKIKLINISGYHSEVINEDGNSIKVDNKSIDNPQGVSPMELLLMGVAGCSSIDIISILKKQKQHFKDLTIEVEGEREKVGLANLFKKIHANVKFTGDVDPKKAHKACQLSFTKYCSVSMMLEGKAEISFSAYINGIKCETT
tara:strand:- start:1779 stop:2204 length:426 start_codon:yes stop_codon:yes gene_type:complete